MTPIVSAIVTTRNEAKNIEACLSSIAVQTFPREKIEIIVVDNDSRDGTRDIAARFTAGIFNQGPERSAQRNFGARRARGKYLLFLDADMILSERVVEECVEKCEREGYAALYIPEKVIGRGFWIQVRNFERSFYDGTVIDAVRFVRTDAFLASGGFDETLTGPEDWDFDRRIKKFGTLTSAREPLSHNEGAFDAGRYYQKKSYYSRSFERYIRKWGRDDETVRKQFGFYYRFIGVYCENGKFSRLLRHPGLALGMYFLRFLVGISYLKHRSNG
uniref:Glycosyl transferase family 2 n=1 Tax=uncultured microorganism TaxID=358574 RepID=F8UHS9_9ZZZZ|nr:glycosyl transferase family 2 [uncultured microorganism]